MPTLADFRRVFLVRLGFQGKIPSPSQLKILFEQNPGSRELWLKINKRAVKTAPRGRGNIDQETSLSTEEWHAFMSSLDRLTEVSVI